MTTATYTKKQIAAIGGNEWTSPRGEVRLYLNDWPALIGMEVERYGTGNISSAAIGGDRLSNSRARDILQVVESVYWSSADQLIHIWIMTCHGRYADTVPGWIRDGIADAVAKLPAE